jgi:alcohol dehydrogenase class IV
LPPSGRDFLWVDGERMVRFGPQAVRSAPDLLRQRGFGDYALLTTRRALPSAPALAEGAGVVLEVPHGGVPEAAAAVRGEVGGRSLVALGGGRVVDTAKAVAGADHLACAAVPTTLSGAEMTGFHRMPAGVDEFRLVRPSLVVGDPALMASQAMPDLAASALNALAHAVEALYTPLANPVAEMVGLRACVLIGHGLESDEPDRDDLALGALLAGWASGCTGYAVHHVLCQTLVRVCGTPHAATNALMLPHSIALMADRAPEAIGLVARALGADDNDAFAAVERARSLSLRAGPAKLSELGVDSHQLPDVAMQAAARAEMQNTPRPPSRNELLDALEAAF